MIRFLDCVVVARGYKNVFLGIWVPNIYIWFLLFIFYEKGIQGKMVIATLPRGVAVAGVFLDAPRSEVGILPDSNCRCQQTSDEKGRLCLAASHRHCSLGVTKILFIDLL